MRPVLDAPALRLALVTVVVLVLQVTIVNSLRISGVTADVMLLLALCCGLVAGPSTGAVAAFFVGLTFDLVLQSPFGLSALVYGVAAYVLGRMQTGMFRSTWWSVSAILALSTALAATLHALTSALFGGAWVGWGALLRIVAVEAGFNAVYGPVVLRVVRWAFGASAGRRDARV